MTTVELKITDYYTVELTDEILENFAEYEVAAHTECSYGEDLEGAALWALDNVYGWDSEYDHEVSCTVITPDVPYEIEWRHKGSIINITVVVTDSLRKEAMNSNAFRSNYEEYDDEAIAQWCSKKKLAPEIIDEVECYDIRRIHEDGR